MYTLCTHVYGHFCVHVCMHVHVLVCACAWLFACEEIRKVAHFLHLSVIDLQVLKCFNLDIKNGSTVALVGESGCGKSTIVKLVQRFYDVQSGDVSLFIFSKLVFAKQIYNIVYNILYIMLCYATLCCAMLCCAMLCCAML